MDTSKMKSLKDLKKELMQDEEFRRDYEAKKPFYDLKRQLIRARIESKLTQEQIAQKMQVKQSVVARFESQVSDFKISTLLSYAQSVGLKKLDLS